jgi:predicted Ser/Thr protein kinase/Tfp pilus assembly protein PilF
VTSSIGRYEVIRPLGRGGMGQVFLARDPRLERDVAIKLLQHESGPARDLFDKEAKALAALSHPNIVTIFEIADADNQHYIAMEYLPGKSLRELMQDKPPREQLLAICTQVATAVDAAHAAGILHRDIKPENVMVGDRVKVVDFGIARRLDYETSVPVARTPAARTARAQSIADAFTRTLRLESDTVVTEPSITAADQTVFGTPAYMAPEVLRGEGSSPASDVYSLGVLLYECLTGNRPHDGSSLVESIARAIGDHDPLVIDDPFGPLVARMLDREPTNRPALAEVARALTRRGSTVSAGARRRRWLVPALAGIAVVALAIAGLALWTTRSRDRGAVAIRLSRVQIPSYGAQSADPRAVSSTLAILVESTGVRVIGPEAFDKKLPATPTDRNWEAAARAEGATLLLQGQIVETNGKLVATLELVDLGSSDRESITIATDIELPQHLDQLVDWIADTVRPGAKLDRTPNRTLAKRLLELARPLVRNETFPAARTFAEQAVHTDESYYEAWELLARVLGYMQAPAATTRNAIKGALARAPDGPRKQLLRAQLLLEDDRPVAALALLAPLETAKLPEDIQRDLLYQLGEAHWHQGHHDVAYRYFQRALAIDSGFMLAASHAGEYALARRRLADARVYLGIQHISFEWAEFAEGNYEQLAASGRPPFNQWSRVVLGQADFSTPPDPLDPVSAIMYRITVVAAAGDEAAAVRGVDELLALLKRAPTGGFVNDLTHVAEVTISAELREPTRRVLEALRATPRYNYKRLAILASPLLGKQTFDRSELTDRLVALEAAYDAELAGDHALAADRLAALIADPTFEWEFAERAALIRILRGLGRTADADAMCATTMKPVIMRYAFVVLKTLCTR